MTERRSIAVLDANAFISMSNIRNLGATTRLVTTEDVLAELRDLKTKEFVDSFPFPIETVNCDDKVLELVKDFAKRTGDIASLSQVDLELIAITHMLYKREGLESQLRKNPPPIQEKDDLQELYNKEDLSSDEEESSEEDTKPLEIVEKPEEENKEEEVVEAKVEIVEAKVEVVEEKKEPEVAEVARKESAEQEEEEWIAVPVKKRKESSSSESESDDEEGWITTKNYEKKMAEITSSFKEDIKEQEEDIFTIWLVSTDFALQNVAVQMGIKLLSLDGRKITTIRRFIYECYLCWKQYRIHDEKVRLCANCGYNSLSKIAYSVDDKGNMILHRKKGWKPNQKINDVKERKFDEQERKKKHQHARRKKKPSIFEK